VLRTQVVEAESRGSAHLSPGQIQPGNTKRTGANDDPAPAIFAIRTMLTMRSSSPFELIDRLEHQLSQQLHSAERVPAAEVHETTEAYELMLELPGVDKAAIEVKATERTLLISAERRSQRQQPASTEAGSEADAAASNPAPAPLLSEFRYGTWGRSFRFPQPIDRDQLLAVYRDGLLTVTAPKAQKLSTVTVQVEG
jgi:HSP20 family protein